MSDLISRQAAIDAICRACQYDKDDYTDCDDRAPSSTFCDYMNALRHLPSAQPDIVQCKDCKHFYLDKPYVIQGVPVLGHEVCDAWGDGCKTSQDGYCFLAERRTDE